MLGSGPGGYTAAFRGADLGLQTVLVERNPTLGGVCLNVGCIPSKALLHAAKVITEAEEMAHFGVKLGKPEVDVDALRGWKESVVKKLTGGLSGLAKGRKVQVVEGVGQFAGPNLLSVETGNGRKTISFDQCIVAAGSEPVKLPFIPHDDPRVIDSTGALELGGVPKRLLVIGGGIIGLEMACVYDALGVEGDDRRADGPDHPRRRQGRGQAAAQAHRGPLRGDPPQDQGDGGRGDEDRAQGVDGGAEGRLRRRLRPGAGRGRPPPERQDDRPRRGGRHRGRARLRPVDKQMRTNVPHIFAIGDVVGQPMLAHKAVHEGKVAAEVAAGKNRAFDARVIPSVAYTDPEVAWVGLTENEAKAKGIKYGKGVFPWAASGRSLSLGRDDGMTKVLFDEADDRVIGAGIVGPNAGDLIAEVAVAIEMGCDATDIGHTIHPHPTLSETVNFAAEMFEGTITDLIPPKKRG